MSSSATVVSMSLSNQTLNILPGNIVGIPVLNEVKESSTKVNRIVEQCIQLSKDDWDSFEVSWDFKKHVLLAHKHESCLIETAFEHWNTIAQERFNCLFKFEEELNSIFASTYGFEKDRRK